MISEQVGPGAEVATSSKAADILDRLAETARQIEGHRAAIFLLELERTNLQTQLRVSLWAPSLPAAK